MLVLFVSSRVARHFEAVSNVFSTLRPPTTLFVILLTLHAPYVIGMLLGTLQLNAVDITNTAPLYHPGAP